MTALRARLDRLTGAPPAAFWWLWGGAFVSALRGRYQGAWSLTFGLGVVLAPTLGSACLEGLGAPALWASCLAVGLLAAAGQLALGPGVRRRLAGHGRAP